MRVPILTLSLVLAGCAREDSIPLTEVDWTNGQQPCSENRLSFREGHIAYRPRGKPALVMFEIESISVDPTDSSITNVVTKPTKAILANVERGGIDVTDNGRAMSRFRVLDGRLSLVGYADADGDNSRPASAAVRRYFDLERCPAEQN